MSQLVGEGHAGETSQGFISICPQIPGFGVGPEAAVCSVTEKGKTNFCLPVAGADLTFAGWVGELSSCYSQREAEQLPSVSSGKSFRLKGTEEVCFFFNQYR